MRRLSTLVLAATLATGAITIAAISPASAAKTPCSDMATTKKNADSGMDMDHGSMDMGGTKKATMHNCPTVAGAREIAVAGDAYTFAPSTFTIEAGEDVTIALTAGDIGHDFYVKGVGHIVHAKAGKTAMGGLRIETPGTYSFWCTVKGHKKSGMTGTITVN